MVSKNPRRNQTLLLILGVTFFSLTLFSGEIIAALVKSNFLSLNLEQISDDGRSKNRTMLANQKFKEITSQLSNAEKMLLESNQKLSELELARKGLQAEEGKLKQSIEKLKFELVDQQNKKNWPKVIRENLKKSWKLLKQKMIS